MAQAEDGVAEPTVLCLTVACTNKTKPENLMLTDEDKAAIAEYVDQQIEARAGAARVAFEMVVEAISEEAERDLRPVFRDALQEAADAIRQQSEDQGDMLDIMADELEAYAMQIEDGDDEPDEADEQG